MDNILKEVENLKQMVLSSEEYKNFTKYQKRLDNNKEISKIIIAIKKKQQEIINKEDNNIYDEKLEFELSNLYKKLESFDDYNNYLKYAKQLNEIITTIQKNFEDYFNKFVI